MAFLHPADLSLSEWLVLAGILLLVVLLIGAFLASMLFIIRFWVNNK